MNFLGRHIQAADGSGVEPERDRHHSARDKPETPGTSGRKHVTNGAGLEVYAVIAVVVFAFAVVNAFSAAHDAVRRGEAYSLSLPLLWEFTSTVVIVALTPLVAFGVRRMSQETAWTPQALWIAGTILVFCALHVVGMVALRKLAYASVGWSYHFGLSLSEFVYELRKDVVTCFMIGAGFWLAARRRGDASEKAGECISAAPKSPDVLWLRDGSKRFRIEPGDILGVSSAGNYVEYILAGGRNHLVRGTLAAEEARLVKFNIVRVHRTRLVNLSRVSGLKAGSNGDFELTLDTGQVVQGSRRYRDAVTSIEALAIPAASVAGDSNADR
jgi:LytTr DNA-binding domain